jgi:catechol 2,3-dioxygenase-like lactoylglutathione lyase family enzyme
MYDHISIGVSDLDRAARFYDPVMSALGYVRLSHNPRHVAYGPEHFKGEAPFAILAGGLEARTPGKGFHLAFAAQDRHAVDRFYEAAIGNGGVDDGPPGIRHNYNPGYYAAFVRDPDGHRLEAVVHELVAR